MYVMPRVFVRASHIEVIREPLYFYSHENKNSIMNGTGDQYIRIRYGRFGGWKVHEEAAAEICPEWQDECAEKAVRSGIRAYMLNVGENAISVWEEQEIRQYLQGRKHLSLPWEVRFMRHMILSDSPCLPVLGQAARLWCGGSRRKEWKSGTAERRVSGVWEACMSGKYYYSCFSVPPLFITGGRQCADADVSCI